VPNTSWVSVAAYSDKISAEAILGLLTAQAFLPTSNRTSTYPGSGPTSACSSRRIECARPKGYWSRGVVSEKELTELATGVKPDG